MKIAESTASSNTGSTQSVESTVSAVKEITSTESSTKLDCDAWLKEGSLNCSHNFVLPIDFAIIRIHNKWYLPGDYW